MHNENILTYVQTCRKGRKFAFLSFDCPKYWEIMASQTINEAINVNKWMCTNTGYIVIEMSYVYARKPRKRENDLSKRPQWRSSLNTHSPCFTRNTFSIHHESHGDLSGNVLFFWCFFLILSLDFCNTLICQYFSQAQGSKEVINTLVAIMQIH